MSEYQFYEFQSIDKPLSPEDRKQIGTWSSRITPTSRGAIFTYSYGDFPKDELAVIEKYFDAMFYISYWGTIRLIFKCPTGLVNRASLKNYCIGGGISIIEQSGHVIVEMEYSDENGLDWIEGKGCLGSLISLREDIMNGDYRALYLVWLRNSMGMADDADEQTDMAPPIPAGMSKLDDALQSLVELFAIDKDYIQAAANCCGPVTKEVAFDSKTSIKKLTEDDKNEFLGRLLDAEALLSAKLKTHIAHRFNSGANDITPQKGKSIAYLSKIVNDVKLERKKADKAKREEQKLKKLKELEVSETVYWLKVTQLINNKNAQSYNDAVAVLKDLKELSVHKGRQKEFAEKVQDIVQEYSRLSSLVSKIKQAKLVD